MAHAQLLRATLGIAAVEQNHGGRVAQANGAASAFLLPGRDLWVFTPSPLVEDVLTNTGALSRIRLAHICPRHGKGMVMLFFSDKAESNGPRIETKLRKELGESSAIPYDVQIEGSFRPDGAAQFAVDIARDLSLALFGVSGTRPLYTFRFTPQGTRPMEVHVPIIKAENRIVLGALVYSTSVPTAIREPLELEDERMFGVSRFKGTTQEASKLNSNKALLKRIHRFLRTSYMVGQMEIKTQRFLTISPATAGSCTVRIGTTPRSRWFGLSSTFDAAEFLTIAHWIEVTLASPPIDH